MGFLGLLADVQLNCMASVNAHTALFTSSGVFRVTLRSIRLLRVDSNKHQSIGPVVKEGLVGDGIGQTLRVSSNGEWSEDRSFREHVDEKIPFRPEDMKKSMMSGILFKSEGQWVGLGWEW